MFLTSRRSSWYDAGVYGPGRQPCSDPYRKSLCSVLPQTLQILLIKNRAYPSADGISILNSQVCCFENSAIIIWWPVWDSNPQPKVLEAPALPLS